MNISFYNENSAKNALKIYINRVSFYFSYNTLVGVIYPNENGNAITAVQVNRWGPTTGKHLNWIDGGDKDERIDETTFSHHVLVAMAIA
jgi:hypothetical protein